ERVRAEAGVPVRRHLSARIEGVDVPGTAVGDPQGAVREQQTARLREHARRYEIGERGAVDATEIHAVLRVQLLAGRTAVRVETRHAVVARIGHVERA